jgi:hypothetical protein
MPEVCPKRLAAAVLLCLLASPVASARQDPICDSVVKIHVTQRYPDFYRPWTKGQVTEGAGTGFVISGKRILTNAHVVRFASQVYVQGHGSSEKLRVEVAYIDAGIDLAVLTLASEAFFNDRPPLELSDSPPQIKTAVELLRDSRDNFWEFRFADNASETLIFRRQSKLDATEEILSDTGIRNQASEALRAICEQKPDATSAGAH